MKSPQFQHQPVPTTPATADRSPDPPAFAEGPLPAAEAWSHLEEGSSSLAEMETMAGLLAGFRLASHSHAQRTPHAHAVLPSEQRTPALPRRLARLTLALVCLALVAGLLLARFPHTPASTASHHTVATPATATPSLSDEALLQGVQQDLNQSVPVSLRSLAPPASRSSGRAASGASQ